MCWRFLWLSGPCFCPLAVESRAPSAELSVWFVGGQREVVGCEILVLWKSHCTPGLCQETRVPRTPAQEQIENPAF